LFRRPERIPNDRAARSLGRAHPVLPRRRAEALGARRPLLSGSATTRVALCGHCDSRLAQDFAQVMAGRKKTVHEYGVCLPVTTQQAVAPRASSFGGKTTASRAGLVLCRDDAWPDAGEGAA